MQRKAEGVKPKLYTTKKGSTGLTLNGLGGIPQFFYKEHIMRLVGDTEDAEKIRKQIREWVAANDAELSNKPE